MKTNVQWVILFVAAVTLGACADDSGEDAEQADVVDGTESDGSPLDDADDGSTTPDGGSDAVQTDTADSTDGTDEGDATATPPGTPNVRFTYSFQPSRGDGIRSEYLWLPSGDAPEGVDAVDLSSFTCEKNGDDLSVSAATSNDAGENGALELDVKRTAGTGIVAAVVGVASGPFIGTSANCYDDSSGIGGDDGPLQITCETFSPAGEETLSMTLNFDPENDCTGLEPENWTCATAPAAESQNFDCADLGRGSDCDGIDGCSAAESCIIQQADYCDAFPSAQGCLNASNSNCAWNFDASNCYQIEPMVPSDCNGRADSTTCRNAGCMWIGEQPCEGTTTCSALTSVNRTVCRYIATCEDRQRAIMEIK